MPGRRIRLVAATVFVAGVFTLASLPASALESSPSSPNSTQEFCFGTTGVDYVHISSTAPRAASGQGWWATINPECAWRTATVTVQLQRRNVLGVWVNIGERGISDVQVGGGSGNRATARYTCSGLTRNAYRSWVDVDIHGILDTPDRVYSVSQMLDCG